MGGSPQLTLRRERARTWYARLVKSARRYLS